MWNYWRTRLGDLDLNSSFATFYSCEPLWASGQLLLPSGSCDSPQFSRKRKSIRLSFPKKNLISMGAEGKVLPSQASHHTSLSWIGAKSQSLNWVFTSESGLTNSPWGWGRPWQSFSKWLFPDGRHRTSGREWGNQRLSKDLRDLRGTCARTKCTMELHAIQSFCSKAQEFLWLSSPAPYLHFFPQILMRLYQERDTMKFGAPWRKDTFLKISVSIESTYGWMVSENNIWEGFWIAEYLLLSWGACRREWLE